MFKILVIFSLIFCVSSGSKAPIIGVLTQETYIIKKFFPNEHHDCFVATSFVRLLESAGAQVIPVWIGQTEEYYRKIVNYTNGIVFPGGGTYFNETKGYGEAAKQIYDLAVEASVHGIHYPILGIGLGLEVLPFADLNGTDIREYCVLEEQAVPLKFTKGYRRSRLFSRTPKRILKILVTDNVIYNKNRYCLTRDALKKSGILPDWQILSTNLDMNGLEVISTMEHTRYPIYGVSFQVNKNQFEFTSTTIPHTSEAVEAAQYFGNFFVDECRKNNNTLPDEVDKNKLLIYNYDPKYIGWMKQSTYEQVYVFNLTNIEKFESV